MKERREYRAREIARMSDEQLSKLPDGGLLITFDDNMTVKCKTRKTVYVAPFWEFMLNNGGKLTQDVSMCKMINGEYVEMIYTTSTHLHMSEQAFWSTFYQGKECPTRFWELSEKIYHATNRIYNYGSIYDERFMSTSWLQDSMEVLLHPKIREYKDQWIKGKVTTVECHDLCYNIVENDTEYFKDNDIHLSVRCGLLSKTQIKQMIGPRGNVPDINSEAFPHEIEAGYYERLNYAYDSIVESKTSSIALYMQGGPLEDSEYNNRLCQLMCSYIRKVEYRDCGSKHGNNVFIKDKDVLKLVTGKYAIQQDGSTYRIRGTEQELIGSIINVRSAATCLEKEQGVVCSHCLGQAAYVVPPGASPGHILIIDPLGQISQTILSTKHVLSNVVALSLEIDRDSSRYIKLHEQNKFVVMLKDDVDCGKLKLKVAHEYAEFLSDLDNIDDAKSINVTAISDIHDMVFCEHENGIIKHQVVCETSVSGTGSCFTPEALQYIKYRGWNIVDGFIEIDLDGWDPEVPLIVTKRVSQDVQETLKQFKAFIAPRKDVTKRRGKSIVECVTPEEAIDELYSVLKSKLKVNYVQLEMFVTSLMSRTDNYMLPCGDEEFRFITMNDSLVNRSALVSLAYQAQSKYILDPMTYCNKPEEIPPHPMDGLFAEGLGFR